jgi:iron(III) transport system ATP-binding protein
MAIKDIHHRFDGPPVVRGVSLELDTGEFLCLLGPSGCGKTTLLRLAAGLEHVQRGRVTISGEVVGDESGVHVPPEARRVGLMFQDFALFPHLSVRQNILFGVRDSNARRRAWIDETAARMGIADLLEAYPHTLSGGQQQRVALARALAPGPRALLLDEPFSGLDVTLRAEVREQTQALLQDTGIASLMVTHDPEEAMFMADRILVMEDGRIVQAGTPEETYFHPASAFVATLFGPVNRLVGRVSGGRVETPLGTFDATGLSDGANAQVMIRPEGLALHNGANDHRLAARVVNARLLGDAIHLRLLVDGGASDSLDLLARIYGDQLPERGSTVSLSPVEANKAFVFPL